jgi:DNA repair protein SbcD/Mre11
LGGPQAPPRVSRVPWKAFGKRNGRHRRQTRLFKFLHAADLHLDSPLRGLDRYDGAPVEAIRQATRRAVENLADLAISEEVAFVLIAGDVYDGDWPDYNTGLFFARQMGKLRDAGIAVYLLKGNHDAASEISRRLSLPDNVAEFSPDEPHTLHHEATNVAIHGQSFKTRAVLEDLSANYPAPDRGCFNIGLLHTAAAGCDGHDPYAPCTVDGLRNRGYDYWALGHIHLRQTLCDDGALINYSGNTQGRHIRETGPKGCLLVTIDGGRPRTEFRPLDVFRWERCSTSASGCATPEDVLDGIAGDLRGIAAEADGRPVAVRVDVTGRSDAHEKLQSGTERWTAEVLGAAARELGERVWIERVRFRTTPPGDEPTELADGPLAELRSHLAEVRGDEALLRELAAEMAEIRKRLPPDLAEEIAPVGNPAWLRSIAEDAEQLLFGRLTARGEG